MQSRLKHPFIFLMMTAAVHLCLAPGLSAITIHEEEKLSDEFMMLVREHYQFVDDFLITDFVSEIGQKITTTLPEKPFPYRFYVVKDPTYNAFAGPGGQIFLNSGLFAAMDSEEEMAGIIGHEISHVACRHISDRIERQKKIGIATLAGVAAGILMGASGASSLGSAATVGSAAAGQSLSLAYSRDDEMQADQMGLDILVKAGYHPQGLLTMLNKIRSQQWFGPKQIPTYLMTHPAVENRIAYISSWMEQNPERVSQATESGPTRFAMMHMRLMAWYENEDTARKSFSDRLEQSADDPLALHGMALLQARLGHRNEAVTLLRNALEKQAFDPIKLSDLGRIFFMDGRYTEARNVLESAAMMEPSNLQTLFYLGRTQMAMERYQDAAQSLERVFGAVPDHLDTLFNLGKTYSALEQEGTACYYLGMYYRLQGDYKNALFQLERARELGADPQKQEEIDRMIREAKKRYRFLIREAEKKQGIHLTREAANTKPFTPLIRSRLMRDNLRKSLQEIPW